CRRCLRRARAAWTAAAKRLAPSTAGGAEPSATSATSARVRGSITDTESASGVTTHSAASFDVSAIVDDTAGARDTGPLLLQPANAAKPRATSRARIFMFSIIDA